MNYSSLLVKSTLPLLLMASGCASQTLSTAIDRTPAGVPVASSASGLKQARISYRARPEAARETVQLASHSSANSNIAAERVLSIEYPHPNGDQEMARASLLSLHTSDEVRRERKRGWLGRLGRWTDRSLPGLSVDDRVSTAKSLTITKSEVDDLVRTIAAEEVLTAGAGGAAEIELQVNGIERSRSTVPLPPLEALANRVASEGRVLPATDPLVCDRVTELAGSKDAFYETLEARLSAE